MSSEGKSPICPWVSVDYPPQCYPPEDASVILTFQAEKGDIELKGKLTSRVIHSVTESIEQGEIGSIGVEFQEPLEEVRSQLNPVFRALGAGPSNT